MTAIDVVEILALLEAHGIPAWVDGGWGVDALLGKQTRPHEDLDLAIQHENVPKLRALLAARGYREVPRADTEDWNFVLGDDAGHVVDIHSFTFDSNGEHTYGVAYPADAFTGTGAIGSREVPCISAERMIQFRTGYALREWDIQDVEALCEKFGLSVPEEHLEWRRRNRI